MQESESVSKIFPNTPDHSAMDRAGTYFILMQSVLGYDLIGVDMMHHANQPVCHGVVWFSTYHKAEQQHNSSCRHTGETWIQLRRVKAQLQVVQPPVSCGRPYSLSLLRMDHISTEYLHDGQHHHHQRSILIPLRAFQ
ncbi:hypothetical protein F2Q70_00028717 [Brassica cretica]|uniref:Uncharacterized protein n=1 Tax=Brassica cretica TaxID=69181 RepID=A0A8S9LGA5_BRACR|nr:hypothetical protein F2Q70_00028717 [Brassica cretica]KAF3580639.1 hypothetical protein DY000_02035812 [Brassica cretica]